MHAWHVQCKVGSMNLTIDKRHQLHIHRIMSVLRVHIRAMHALRRIVEKHTTYTHACLDTEARLKSIKAIKVLKYFQSNIGCMHET